MRQAKAKNPVTSGIPENLSPAAELQQRDRIRTYLPGNSTLADSQAKATQQLVVRDDIAQEFGEDIYDQMYRDPAIHAAIQALRITVTANGVRAQSSARSVRDTDYGRRAEEAKSCSRMLEALSQDVYDLTVALPYRHALAELNWELVDDPWLKKPIWNVRRMKVKNRRNYYLICDYDLDLIGVVNVGSQKGFASNTEQIPPDSIVPAEKVILFVPFALEADPRGHSLMRSAYNPWRIKAETWSSYFRYLNKFAVPDIVITASEATSQMVPKVNYTTGTVEEDSAGAQVEETREMANYRAAMNLVIGGANVLSLPPNTTASLLFAQGNGEAFTKAFEALDRQMVMSILLSARALLEALKSSKADSETAADIFDVLVSFVRRMLEQELQSSVVDRWYRYNIGDDVENAPRVSLSDDTGRNFVKAAPAVASLLGQSFFHESQYEGLDTMLGAPPRDYEAWAEELQADKEKADAIALETSKLLNPAVGGVDDSEDVEEPDDEDPKAKKKPQAGKIGA